MMKSSKDKRSQLSISSSRGIVPPAALSRRAIGAISGNACATRQAPWRGFAARRGAGLLDRLNGQPQAHGFENGREGAKLRVAFAGKRAVKMRPVELRLSGQAGNAAEGLAHLAQRNQQFALIAVGKDVVEQFRRVGRVFLKEPRHHVVVRLVTSIAHFLPCSRCQSFQ